MYCGISGSTGDAARREEPVERAELER